MLYTTPLPPLLLLLLAGVGVGEQFYNPDCLADFDGLDFKENAPCAVSHVVLGSGDVSAWCAEVCWPRKTQLVVGAEQGTCVSAGFTRKDTAVGAPDLDRRHVSAYTKPGVPAPAAATTTLAFVAAHDAAPCVEARGVSRAAAQLLMHMLAPLVREGTCAGAPVTPCPQHTSLPGDLNHPPTCVGVISGGRYDKPLPPCAAPPCRGNPSLSAAALGSWAHFGAEVPVPRWMRFAVCVLEYSERRAWAREVGAHVATLFSEGEGSTARVVRFKQDPAALHASDLAAWQELSRGTVTKAADAAWQALATAEPCALYGTPAPAPESMPTVTCQYVGGHLRIVGFTLSTDELSGALAQLTELRGAVIMNVQAPGAVLPRDIGRLRHLRLLDISASQGLGGTLPPSLGIATLEWLKITGSSATYARLCVVLCCLTCLTYLHAAVCIDAFIPHRARAQPTRAGTRIAGTLPSALFPVGSRLRDLSLTDNLLTGVVPTSIGNLEQLVNIRLFENCGYTKKEMDARGMDPASCRYFARAVLEGADPSAPRDWCCPPFGMQGPLPVELKKCTKLATLWLDQNNFGGGGEIPAVRAACARPRVPGASLTPPPIRPSAHLPICPRQPNRRCARHSGWAT
jgi:hypothetical protein